MSGEVLTYTNENGQSIVFTSDASSYMMNVLSGLGAPSVDVQTQKAPYQDGTTLLDKIMDDRTIQISFTILADSNEDLYNKRRNVAKILNPKYKTGQIRYVYAGGTKVIEATVQIAPLFSMTGDVNGETWQRASVAFTCNTYWNDEEDTSFDLVSFEGYFEFPAEFTDIEFGIQGASITIDNDGDAELPITLYIFGEIEEPTITNNTTGEFITLLTTIDDGDYVRIKTGFGEKEVTLVSSGVETNIFHLIDLDTTFFTLEIGENDLAYESVSEGANAYVSLSYNNRYIGI